MEDNLNHFYFTYHDHSIKFTRFSETINSEFKYLVFFRFALNIESNIMFP